MSSTHVPIILDHDVQMRYEVTPKTAVIEALKLKKRIPELEPIILQSPVAACFYALKVVKGRWEEAEQVIASGSDEKLYKFDKLDKPHLSQYARPDREYVDKYFEQYVYVVYTTLIKKRCPSIEEHLKKLKWHGNAYRYCKLIYRLTKEVIDLDSPEVCLWILKDISTGQFAKKLNKEDRLKICNDLHKRMILHSFAHKDNRVVREYFKQQKKTQNDFLIQLSQHDENMTVKQLIDKLTRQ